MTLHTDSANEPRKGRSAPESGEQQSAAPTPPQDDAAEAPHAPVYHAVVLDDEPANRDFLMRLIEQADYQVHGASYGQEAIQVAQDLPTDPSLIIVDSQLPDVRGTDLVKVFRERYPQAKIIMATMLDERSLIRTAFGHGCDVFLVKPHGFMELFKRLKCLATDPDCLSQLIIDGNGVRPFKA
ncbi:MAG: response regulator transcription factor [Anaerolineales bacterium]